MGPVIQREWQRVRLRGNHWWVGTTLSLDHQRENPRAVASRIETEDHLTKLLAEGWTIASVVSVAPILLYQTRAGALWQEAFTVFLERPLCDSAPDVVD